MNSTKYYQCRESLHYVDNSQVDKPSNKTMSGEGMDILEFGKYENIHISDVKEAMTGTENIFIIITISKKDEMFKKKNK